jgi:aldehyde:ferredoxin oxidoreductase
MYAGGYTGTILRIDLTSQTATREPLPLEVAQNYLGGAGFGIKYLYDEVPGGTDPLGPGNKLIFAPGPFTGTTIPCASRMVVVTRSPLTGAVGMATTGGHFPAEMKMAGYDMLIVEGKAAQPTVLIIRGEDVVFRDGGWLWGTDTGDCQQLLKDDLHDQSVRIACIGPAGENQSLLASIINERRAFGRKGVGAVMGSKNLKAIAMRGTEAPHIVDDEAFKVARGSMRQSMKESPVLYSQFAKLGTPMVVDLTMSLGIFPAKNWTATGAFAPAEQLGAEAQVTHNVRRNPCFNCPVACSQIKIARSGPHKGMIAEGPEYETYYSFGGTTGVDDHDAIIAADRMCDELGIDTMSAGVAIGFAMELAEKGLLTVEQTGGQPLRFGDAEAMLTLLHQMAYREGLGALLADGVKKAAEQIGNGADYYAMHVKGLELPAYDVRGAKGHGLNYATSYTGADHNRGYAFQEIFGLPVPWAVDRFSTDTKGALTKWNQDVRTATCDCPTMCAFLLDTSMPHNATENTSALMKAVTGLDITPDEVQTVGDRVNTLAKAFNTRDGFTRADDTLPRRLMEEPLTDGASKGNMISQADLDLMLDEYYTARGYDPKTGVPTRAKLESLGLGYVADDLGV